MKSLNQFKNIKDKRVLLRVDFNVPISKGKILDDFRIKQALPTISYLRKKGAKIILLSHLGRSGGSLKPIAEYLNKFFPVQFGQGKPLPGKVILLENLRQNPGEEKNDLVFAKKLAKLGDVYINEAFSVSHRKQASISQLPKLLPSYFGFQFEREIKNLSSVFKPKKPMLLILGGAKFETKMPMLKKFIKIADYIFVAGALANNFFKEIGFEVGRSVVDEKNFGLKKLLASGKIFLPIDVVVKKGNKKLIKAQNEVGKDEKIVDIGPTSVKLLEHLIGKSKFVLWNGPLGWYEGGFGGSTERILKFKKLQKNKTIIGGGDTVALVSKLKLDKKLTFVSTGGGAMLEFLSKGKLLNK
ncbi:phosphoglycerate kinase [Candidatus Nomurabacteria bacterium RIFCSPHIGHO2_01_FULL_39_9]|uniref:Phosphoglycerate kinase n=1 Tax=Candidatus Nomurabacteria bacterium RIFCSPHIGHO2_01_FULL_39_9 TaxID=1801735 RepID=A0A1F6UV01_9BACT|nr:MAG: phosphoglycerate kinase [Candidatus Nomurabacteria bacterium RIFCSPHIGHO2_01_FULL_39_9]